MLPGKISARSKGPASDDGTTIAPLGSGSTIVKSGFSVTSFAGASSAVSSFRSQ